MPQHSISELEFLPELVVAYLVAVGLVAVALVALAGCLAVACLAVAFACLAVVGSGISTVVVHPFAVADCSLVFCSTVVFDPDLHPFLLKHHCFVASIEEAVG